MKMQTVQDFESARRPALGSDELDFEQSMDKLKRGKRNLERHIGSGDELQANNNQKIDSGQKLNSNSEINSDTPRKSPRSLERFIVNSQKDISIVGD